MAYRVGVTRKTNVKVNQWVAADGYTSRQEEAKQFGTREEATQVARGETSGKWRGVVEKIA
jgi:hypothetical protein